MNYLILTEELTVLDQQDVDMTNQQCKRDGLASKCICGSSLAYKRKWDAYYCIDSLEWVEKKCSDLKCEFCANRPDKPSPWTKKDTP